MCGVGTPSSAQRSLIARILRQAMSKYFGPPHPGLTSITTTTSTPPSTCSTESSGVAGLSTTPGAQPASSIRPSTAASCIVVSGWTEITSAPALTNSATRSSGRHTPSFTSSTASGKALRAAETTGEPNDTFGTKRPSWTEK